MCGRTACTLDKNGIQLATCKYSRNNENLQWIQKYDWQNYHPNYNISPSQISPVIVNGSTFSANDTDNLVLTPMRWGLIPSWYRGTLQECPLKNNNCRQEGLLEKPTFKGAAKAGRRCIVLADGFYEWKATDSKHKQPYFIYFPQEEGPDVFTRDPETFNQGGEWKGPQLLTMAGLFDVWKGPQNECIYSYSVITLDSSKSFAKIHERMPAILTGKDEVSMWLDTNRVPTKDAMSLVKPVENLQMHKVPTLVNFSRNNSVDLIKPLQESESKPPLKHTGLTSWLIKIQRNSLSE
ncbi:hypothetical protein JTE90_025882 [Oedothorax gibbosus]|uniref:Abasic site processing protein HMCES n=1 Tax=Oedothorax gibbosus TaxID=931172 RepID=A0AAV6UNP9_9ARAC|nr:hypothetical protein JTE90_025882 [Oedothorax gibbosus]